MRIGFNFTLGSTMDLVQRLIRERRIDYCELLIDNFLQVPPAQLAAAFDCPLGFHIMFSKFLESDVDYLEAMAERLHRHIEALQPLYVSDHIARFNHGGRQLYHLAEIDYDSEYRHVRDRVEYWQARLGQRLHLENYPSLLGGGRAAPEFFARLIRETGAGLLFDVSNAICAQRNGVIAAEAWLPLIEAATHFHIAGYRESILAPKLTLDTHDAPLADDTLEFLARYRTHFDKPGATLTYERDDRFDEAEIDRDLAALRAIFPRLDDREHADAA